jgi:hypothetical protein
MKHTLRLLAVTGSLLCSAAVSNANLIVNGSFETPDQGTGWNAYASISGWTAVGVYGIEIGDAGNYGGITGYDGHQVMELDSYGNVVVDQTIPAFSGSLELSFLYAERGGVPATSTTFDVYWNSALVGHFAPTDTAMALFSTSVTSGAINTLEFVGTGTEDSLGALIDNVQLNGVPDGGTTVTLFGLALTGLGLMRRKQS